MAGYIAGTSTTFGAAVGLGASGLGPRGLALCSPKPPWLLRVSYLEVPLAWVKAGLRVGRPVGNVPPWGVIAVTAYWPMGTQPALATQALNNNLTLIVCNLRNNLLLQSLSVCKDG